MRKGLTISDIKRKLSDKGINTFEILQTINPSNVHESIKVKCKLCNTIHEKRINSLLHGYNCIYCKNTGEIKYVSRNATSITAEIQDITNGEYEIISLPKKISIRSSFKLKHKLCKHEFSMCIHNFIHLGQRCPKCMKYLGNLESKPVKKIKEILTEYNIPFEVEKRFSDLFVIRNKKKYPLSFDFFLPENNIVIEYDGEQHFKPQEMFGGENYYRKCVENDKIKDEYCRTNGIQIIRIPYTVKHRIKDFLNNQFIE